MPTCTNMAVTMRHHSPIDQHAAGVVGAPVHELIDGGTPDADPAQHHGQKYRAVDAHQQIGGRSGGPAGAAARRRRRRIFGSAEEESPAGGSRDNFPYHNSKASVSAALIGRACGAQRFPVAVCDRSSDSQSGAERRCSLEFGSRPTRLAYCGTKRRTCRKQERHG